MVRRFLVPVVAVLVASVLGGCSACTDQFDPTHDKARFERERAVATASTAAPRLSKTGELPTGTGPVVDINERYATLCSSCHGPQGKGDGPGGVALTPKPRDFSDKAWAGSVDDARIATVIKSGGPAVGLSPAMAPWGSVLSDAEITAMVAKVRSFSR